MHDLIRDATEIIASLGTLVMIWQLILTRIEGRRTAAKVEEVHLATNSMKDALVKATGEAAHAAGVEVGKALQTAADAAAQSGS